MMSSAPASTPAQAEQAPTNTITETFATENLTADGEVEADDNDSTLDTDFSDTTSIASSIYAGYIENGRRYQTVREGEYWGPSDDKQFESMQSVHTMYQILESQQPNNLFRSPLGEGVQNILDIGTGNGAWCRDVADKFPNALVQGIDLYPPPDTWVPPNCKFVVDDCLKPWMFQEKFDLIHLRLMVAAFEPNQWKGVYKQAFQNLVPGGWIEQTEPDLHHYSDDGTIPKDSAIAQWGDLISNACTKAGKPADNINTMRSEMERAGFINIQEKTYKVPIGTWAKNPILKEAGKFNKVQFKEGMEGFAMFILTKFGSPEPWSAEEVQVYLAKARADLDKGYHGYMLHRRVWGQKPVVDAEVKA